MHTSCKIRVQETGNRTSDRQEVCITEKGKKYVSLMEELKKINRIIDREFPDAHREAAVGE